MNKMTTIKIAIGAVFLFLLNISTVLADYTSDVQQIAQTNNEFALDMFSISRKKTGNFTFSPYSIASALAMTAGGARGDTAYEIAETMHFNLGPERTHSAFTKLNSLYQQMQEKGHIQLYIANALWPHKDFSIQADFLQFTQHYYGVSITPVDYMNESEAARQIINNWVKENTSNKISEILRPGDLQLDTLLVLINAIYFKGDWAKQFNQTNTRTSDFHLTNDSTKKVPLMNQQGNFRYAVVPQAKILELPYIDKQLSMVFILPDTIEGLDAIENQLTAEQLNGWLSQLSSQNVNVHLPRFKISSGSFLLNDVLKTLGIRKAFAVGADFSGMDATRSMYIGAVMHKAFVAVNEEGSEAAASTAVINYRSAVPKNNGAVNFKADHPFLFIIKDNLSENILFLGRVVDPISEKE
jgi:serpin B